MKNILLVFLGGGLGSIMRFGISEFIKPFFKSSFPISTLCSNLLSCVLLGITFVLINEKIEYHYSLKLLLIIGFCGGLSTFSTFSFETVELIRSGNILVAIANILISTSVCIAIIYFLTKQSI